MTWPRVRPALAASAVAVLAACAPPGAAHRTSTRQPGDDGDRARTAGHPTAVAQP